MPSCSGMPGWTRLGIPEDRLRITGPEPTWRGIMSVAAGWGDRPSLYVAGQAAQLHRSQDCGLRWDPIPVRQVAGEAPGAEPLVVVATDRGGRLYTSGAAHTPILVSGDGGATWYGTTELQSRSIASSPLQDGLVYAVLSRFFVGGAGIGRSTDGGLTWEILTPSSFRGVIATSASDPDLVYLGGAVCPPSIGRTSCGVLYQSVDGGITTERLAVFESPITALGIAADGVGFWLATQDGQLYRSPDRDSTWEAVAQAPGGNRIISLSPRPEDPSVIFAVTSDATLWAYREELTTRSGARLRWA
jgi:photosystem II stability/assembly factor-like uncharacterized protein